MEPGHLVWVPFGPQKLQGVVLRTADYSPVPTKAVLRLARPEPVLTPCRSDWQSGSPHSMWPRLAEAIKLFLPPGLLARADGTAAVHAKRELRANTPGPWRLRRSTVGSAGADHAGKQNSGLAHCRTGETRGVPGAATDVTWKEIKQAVGVSQRGPLAPLEAAALVTVEGDCVRLSVSAEQAQAALRSLQGLDKYIPVIDSPGGGRRRLVEERTI